MTDALMLNLTPHTTHLAPHTSAQANDVHRVRFSWYTPQSADDEFELVIRDLDSGKNLSAGAALADTGVDPMFLSVFEWLTSSTEAADISRRVDLEDVAEESRKLPIKAISFEQVRLHVSCGASCSHVCTGDQVPRTRA
jgi:hypothetical protein